MRIHRGRGWKAAWVTLAIILPLLGIKPALIFLTATKMLSNLMSTNGSLNTAEISLADALPSPLLLPSPRLPERTPLTGSGVTGLMQ